MPCEASFASSFANSTLISCRVVSTQNLSVDRFPKRLVMQNLRPAGSWYGLGFVRLAIHSSTNLAHLVRVSSSKVLENCSKASACFLRIATASLKRLRNRVPKKLSSQFNRKRPKNQLMKSNYFPKIPSIPVIV